MERAASTSRPAPLAPPDARRVCVFIVNPRGGGGAGAGAWARARAVVERRLADVCDIQARAHPSRNRAPIARPGARIIGRCRCRGRHRAS